MGQSAACKAGADHSMRRCCSVVTVLLVTIWTYRKDSRHLLSRIAKLLALEQACSGSCTYAQGPSSTGDP